MLGVVGVLATTVVVVLLACSVSGGGGGGGGWSRYTIETTVLVSEAKSGRGVDAGAGATGEYRVRGHLEVHATTTDKDTAHDHDESPTTTLLAFTFQDMELMVRGAEPGADYQRRDSMWGGREDVVYVPRRAGLVLGVLHDPAVPRGVLDHVRGVVSLFQYRVPRPGAGGEGGNETDVSGDCVVSYETLATHVFRKVKRRCEHDEVGAGGGVVVEPRRVTRYTLAGAGDEGGTYLTAVLADEVVTVRVGEVALKARSLHTLTLLDHRPGAGGPPALTPRGPPPHYIEATLAMSPLDPHDPDDDLSVEDGVREFGAALEGEEAGGGGSAEGAAALVRLVPLLQAASVDALATVLRSDLTGDRLRGVCAALGLAGTAAGAAAVRRAELPAHLVRAYLAGLGVSRAPHLAAVQDALALAEAGGEVGEAALLAAAAAAPRAPQTPLLARLRDTLAKGLARCKDDRCRRVRVAALGNMAVPEVVETLLAHAEREGGAGAVWAVGAVGAVPRLLPRHLDRLAALAGNTSRPLEERALALDLLAEREARGPALPLRTADAWRALHAERGPAAGELRRLLAQRVAALAPRHESARRLLGALPPQMRGWDAPPGASTVLVREPGWAAPGAGWRAQLDSRQVTERGLLRRGRVSLEARDAHHSPAPLLSVELWTRGLGALAPAPATVETPEEQETMSAGLHLTVAGVSLPDIDLFEGQSELVGHVWAGTGSTATSVVRAARVVAGGRGAVPLAGGVALGVRAGAVVTAALDARASVSLWQRAARGALVLRAAAAARLVLVLAPPTGAVRVEARAAAAPRLSIHADLDFYDGVTLCVRAATAPHEESRDTWSSDPRVTRGRTSRLTRPGRTISLGRENDHACRTLTSNDDDDGGE